MAQASTYRAFLGVFAAGLTGALSAPARAATAEDVQLQASWRAAIEHSAAPSKAGCFHAAYPNLAWQEVACAAAAAGPLGHSQPAAMTASATVGNGHDFAAETNSAISKAVGSFPAVSGITSESDSSANKYSLQLNMGTMSSLACHGGGSACKGWQQFVYASGEQSVFMQYWLIGYGAACPRGGGWTHWGKSDCYKNSRAIYAPQIPITDLGSLKITGTAAKGGNDTVTLTTATDAYSISGPDSVLYASKAWTLAEWNVFGDGDGTRASFNSGASITVRLALTDGSSSAPRCAIAGQTGETSNLDLGASCKTAGGATPSIQFTESD